MKLLRVIVFLLLALAVPGHGAAKVNLQKNQFDPINPPKGAKFYSSFTVRETLSGSFYYEQVDAGHLVYVQGGLESFASGRAYQPKKLTVLSITGAEVDQTIPVEYFRVPPALGQTPFYMTSVPYTYLNQSGGFAIPLRASPPKSGAKNPVPIVIKVRFEGEMVSFIDPNVPNPSPVDVIYEYVVPVSEAPALEATASFTSVNAGELRPEGAATVSYRVKASGAPITDLSFHARIPSGTFLVPGQVFPADGVVSGTEVIWRVPGPVMQFDASIDVRVKPRPPRTAMSAFQAVGAVSGYIRAGRGMLKMPVKKFDQGVIEYIAPTGLGGAVQVGETYAFQCSEWDAEGGDIFVALNDIAVTAVPLSNPAGQFTIPPFRDPDLEQVLSAHQKGPTVDTTVTGERVAQLELVEGVVKVTDGTTIYRRLKRGNWLATGEVPTQPDVTAPGNCFGLLQIDGPTGAALVNYSGDQRLLYARDGKVAVFGPITIGKQLRLGTGKKTLTLPYRSAPFPFADYDPIGKTGLVELTVSQIDRAADSPFEIFGFVRSGHSLRILGPVEIQGGIFYVDGDLIIEGDVLGGGGAILCTGNFTHKGALQLSNIALDVGGTFTTTP